MAIFSPDLACKQLNGKIISREQLRKDAATQFARLAKTESAFTRERIECRGSDVVECLAQDAIAGKEVFFFQTNMENQACYACMIQIKANLRDAE
jgi:hypothetical protein